MEGVSSEAASLAGHLQLDNLAWIYDNNRITIEGRTALAFSEDVATRFISYGWNVTRVGDANDLEMLDRRSRRSRRPPAGRRSSSWTATLATARRPSRTRTPHTVSRSAKRRSARRSGSTAGRRDAKFLVPDGVREQFAAGIGARGAKLRNEWLARFEAYKAKYPDEAEALSRMQRRQLPDGWEQASRIFPRIPRAGRTRRVGKGSQRRRATHSLVDWRVRRPRAVDEDATHVRRRRRFRSRLV
jgi:transketolase